MATTPRRWLRALRRIWSVEIASPALTTRLTPVAMRCAGRLGWASDGGYRQLRGREAPETHDCRIPTWTSADGIVIGKFDVDREVRLRAFYLQGARTAKFQPAGTVRRRGRGSPRPQRDGITRSVQAWRTLAGHDPGLMPRLLDTGRTRCGSYLVEQTIHGRIARPGQITTQAGVIAGRLLTAQQAAGITSVRLTSVLHPDFVTRWLEVSEVIDLPADLTHRIVTLTQQDRLVEVGMTHGDLVGSNVLITGPPAARAPDADADADADEAGFQLIDWEYAGAAPIAFDLAKLEINASRPAAAMSQILTSLQGRVGGSRDHVKLREQIAMGHAQILTWHSARVARAAASGRMDYLVSNTRQRVVALRRLLEV